MTDPAREQLDQIEQRDQVPGSGPGPGPEAEARLAAAEAKAEEHLNDLKRLAAEFENYKKRSAREQASLSARATERLVKELLPIVDDLERALEAAAQPPVRDGGPVEGARGNRAVPPADLAEKEAKLEEGVRLVHRQLASALEREGLAEIETDGKFDPHVHEALLSQPSDADEGSVIEVLQKGYRLGDRVLRPARVVVAAAKEANGDGDS
jgi:molecular chaperone GrpE